MYRNAKDFRTPSMRAIRRIASDVTDGATPKAGEKISRPVSILTEIASVRLVAEIEALMDKEIGPHPLDTATVFERN